MARGATIALLSTVIWIAFLIHSGMAVGVASMPCDGGNIAWCWMRDTLGLGPAWLLLHALVSLFLGWAFVILPTSQSRRRG